MVPPIWVSVVPFGARDPEDFNAALTTFLVGPAGVADFEQGEERAIEQFADGHCGPVGGGQRDVQQAFGVVGFERSVIGAEDPGARDLPGTGATIEGHFGAHGGRDVEAGQAGIAQHRAHYRQGGKGDDFSRVEPVVFLLVLVVLGMGGGIHEVVHGYGGSLMVAV